MTSQKINFDEEINRIGTHAEKWDDMEAFYGVSPRDGLAMWVADMDFRPPAVVQSAVQQIADHGVYGYYGNFAPYREAVCWWMQERHGWTVDPKHIFTTHGLVNGIGLSVDAFTSPGDSVALMTPVYHAFARVILAAGRKVTEMPLVNPNGRYEMDFDGWEARLTGREKMLILCSPHNPGGRVWTPAELRAVADFCVRHDLILISDEIHHDLVLPGQRHMAMPVAAPDIADRLVMLTSTSKTFNIAGTYTGNVIISDQALHARFAARVKAFGISPNSFGLHMATAAYSPAGAIWVDELTAYLAGNAAVLDQGLNAIPGVRSMALEGTYLAWVDFSGTGMAQTEIIDRVQKGARIAASHGANFGMGGESWLRFNIGTTRARVVEAVDRMQKAFADLQ